MFKSKLIDIEAGEPIIIMNPQDTAEMGIREMDRVHVEKGGRNVVAIVQESKTMVSPGEVGVIMKIQEDLMLKDNEEIAIKYATRPQSIDFIK